MVAQTEGKRPGLESPRFRVAGLGLQPRPQKPARQRRYHPPPAGAACGQHPPKGTAHRRDHGHYPEASRKTMSGVWPSVRLGEVLHLDLDRVPVDAATTYPMVGVLSFGRGLFD